MESSGISPTRETNGGSLLTPWFLLRVSGLPFAVIERLCFTQTQAALERLAAVEQELLGCKERLVDLLHAAVGLHREERDCRRLLINFKRDVFNLRRPCKAQALEAIRQALPPDSQQVLDEWLALWQRYGAAEESLKHVFDQELVQERRLLKASIAHDDFRKGLLLASPLLAREVDAYLASPEEGLSREERTVERSLFAYLLRSACKTSPFSTLTAVALGKVIESQERTTARGLQPEYCLPSVSKESRTCLNLAVLGRLSFFLQTHEQIWLELPVRLSDGWQHEGNHLRYLRRRQQFEEAGADAALLDLVQEEIFYLPIGPCLKVILRVMEERRTLRVGELLDILCERLAVGQARPLITAYLMHLLRLGLLGVSALQADIHSLQPVGAYLRELESLELPLARQLAKQLEEAERLIISYASASRGKREHLLVTLQQSVARLFALAGQPGASMPRVLLYEDTFLQPERLEMDRQSWTSLLTELEALQQLLPLFDLQLPRRLVMRAYFEERYGTGARCDDVLAFVGAFTSDFFLQYAQDLLIGEGEGGDRGRYLNPLDVPAIAQLNGAYRAALDFLRQAQRRCPPDSLELILDEEFLRAILPLLPQGLGLQSHAFFTQLIDGPSPSDRLLVINRIYNGLTAMFSRFIPHFVEREGEGLLTELQTWLMQLQPAEAVFAELKGGYTTSNLNVHPALIPYELVCPGEVSRRSQNEQIPLTDLYIEDDPRAGCLKLYSRRLGKEVIPVYLGFLLPLALPQIQQVLLNFSCVSLCQPNWGPAFDDQRAEKEEIIFYPRLRYKHLVLQRATWKLPVTAFPARARGECDSAFYRRVWRWGKERRLPKRLFWHLEHADSASSAAENDESEQSRIERKPMYLDFENYFCVALLESSLRRFPSARLVLTEMLPDGECLWLKHGGASYVTELVLELTRRSEGEKHVHG